MTTPQRKTSVPMTEQPPSIRRANFLEVPLGYTSAEAKEEAGRCLNCKKPLCVEGCPVGVAIPQFVQQIALGNFDESAKVLKGTNALPAVCGRVCPQEEQCEAKCILGNKGTSVSRSGGVASPSDEAKRSTAKPW